MKGSQILIVEDEHDIALSISERIIHEGWGAHVVSNGSNVIQAYEKFKPDAVILDIMLPGMNGFEVIKQLRKISVVPIIILTARIDEVDEVRSLNLGADDFLHKPLRPSKLVAHIRAWLRRYEFIKKQLSSGGANLEFGIYKLILSTHELHVNTSVKKVIDNLTPIEFTILKTFLQSPNDVFSRSELFEAVWGYDASTTSRTLDAHIKGLRKKVGHEIIKTVHGVGYRLTKGE